MTDYNFEGLISVSMLAALRNILGMECASEQGIRTQIRQLESGERASKDVGFEVVRIGSSVVMIKLLDKKLEKFRVQLMDFAAKNRPQ